jgi:hypothetical protein
VGIAIKFLSRAEDRDELPIYSDLTRADRDVVRVRAPQTDDDGSIEIEYGVELVQQARDMLASAACAAHEPRRAYHLGKVQEAAEYMRRVRLGQTEHGSFVVTLLAPMPPALDLTSTSFWPELDTEPYERRVTRTLNEALETLQSSIVASNRGNGLAAFTAAVLKGVSANLCEAVAAIVEQANGADLSVTWAKTRPTPKARAQTLFQARDADILREAARQLRLHEPLRDERILGYVTHLRRTEQEFDGHVTIKAIVEGRARSLSAELEPEDYHAALYAHGKKLAISMVGDIEMRGQRWRIIDPRNIQILQDDDDDGKSL